MYAEHHGRSPSTHARAFANLYDWILSLPWVVERPTIAGWGRRVFAVECAPLHRKRVWLLMGQVGPDSGAARAANIALIVPIEAMRANEGIADFTVSLPAGCVLLHVRDEVLGEREEVERLILTAYGYAMS